MQNLGTYLCTETEEGLDILIKRTPGKNLDSKTEQKFLVALEIFVNMLSKSDKMLFPR